MNNDEAKQYLQENLPSVTVTVEENYTNQHTINATRFIFSKDGIKDMNILFKKGFKLGHEVLDGVIVAINKKLKEAPTAEVAPEEKPTSEVKEPANIKEGDDFKVPEQDDTFERQMYEAAKKVVKTYERKFPMV